MKKTFVVLAALALGAMFFTAASARTGGKDSRWKKFLPDDAHKELVDREVTILQGALANPDENSIVRARLAAVMIVGLSRSVPDKGKNEFLLVEPVALVMAKLLKEKGKIAEARKLIESLKNPKGKFDPWDKEVNLKKVFGADVLAMMDHLRTKAKGGDGIPEALQTNIRLKGALNGIEEKVRSLAMKKMTDAAMNKSAAEMVLFGYRLAVLAEVTDDFAPEKKVGKKDPKVWHELSVQMRDSALEMAAASKKKDAAVVFDAAGRLNTSCNQCHSVFR
jgi:hypothetical protein